MSSGRSELSTSSVIGIHHIGMSVSDLKASVEFYSEALGVDLHSTPGTMQVEDVSLGFSTFGLEVVNFIKSAQWLNAFVYISLNFLGTLLAIFLGFRLYGWINS